MKSKVWYIVSAYMASEYVEAPSYAYIEITSDLYKTIKKAQKFVAMMKGYSFTTFDYTPEWGDPVDGCDLPDNPTYENLSIDEEVRIDNMELKVTTDTVYWSGNIKHADGEYYTDQIPIKELDENFKVLRCKLETLPMFINHCEYESSKRIVNERLKHDRT